MFRHKRLVAGTRDFPNRVRQFLPGNLVIQTSHGTRGIPLPGTSYRVGVDSPAGLFAQFVFTSPGRYVVAAQMTISVGSDPATGYVLVITQTNHPQVSSAVPIMREDKVLVPPAGGFLFGSSSIITLSATDVFDFAANARLVMQISSPNVALGTDVMLGDALGTRTFFLSHKIS